MFPSNWRLLQRPPRPDIPHDRAALITTRSTTSAASATPTTIVAKRSPFPIAWQAAVPHRRRWRDQKTARETGARRSSCDSIAPWRTLGISGDSFIRAASEKHEARIRRIRERGHKDVTSRPVRAVRRPAAVLQRTAMVKENESRCPMQLSYGSTGKQSWCFGSCRYAGAVNAHHRASWPGNTATSRLPQVRRARPVGVSDEARGDPRGPERRSSTCGWTLIALSDLCLMTARSRAASSTGRSVDKSAGHHPVPRRVLASLRSDGAAVAAHDRRARAVGSSRRSRSR